MSISAAVSSSVFFQHTVINYTCSNAMVIGCTNQIWPKRVPPVPSSNRLCLINRVGPAVVPMLVKSAKKLAVFKLATVHHSQFAVMPVFQHFHS